MSAFGGGLAAPVGALGGGALAALGGYYLERGRGTAIENESALIAGAVGMVVGAAIGGALGGAIGCSKTTVIEKQVGTSGSTRHLDAVGGFP